MTTSMSKRQLARNERDLQDLIVSVPGNDRCADCQARNPGSPTLLSWQLKLTLIKGWASWNVSSQYPHSRPPSTLTLGSAALLLRRRTER